MQLIWRKNNIFFCNWLSIGDCILARDGAYVHFYIQLESLKTSAGSVHVASVSVSLNVICTVEVRSLVFLVSSILSGSHSLSESTFVGVPEF